MIVMPQLYQHEILFRALDAMGHQGISKVVARIQERHTWPEYRRTVGEYVSHASLVSKFPISLETFVFISKTNRVDTSLSWSNTTT